MLYLASIGLFVLITGFHASFVNRNIRVGLLSIVAAFVMLTGYGTGMIGNFISRKWLRSSKETEKPLVTRE
jgi:amino acid transporter